MSDNHGDMHGKLRTSLTIGFIVGARVSADEVKSCLGPWGGVRLEESHTITHI